MKISQESFGILNDTEEVLLIKMQNNNGIEVEIISYGAIIKSIRTPDLNGDFCDIVLGKKDLQAYVEDDSCIGAVVGPVAGRIGNAEAIIDHKKYQFDKNDNENTLHGGSAGLHKKNWLASISKNENSVKVELKYEAKDLEGGFPGNRIFTTTYILNNKNQLMVYFDATTDKNTIINLSTHSYYNLSGKHPHIHDHKMMINSLKTLNTTEELIPDGTENYVLGLATNFSRGAILGEALKRLPKGLDHAYIINKGMGQFGISAKAVHEQSGRTIDMVTDQPIVILYTSNHFDGSKFGRNGDKLEKHAGFCLEPQHHPDAPNHNNFPTIEIKAGEKYKSRTQITFGLTSDKHH